MNKDIQTLIEREAEQLDSAIQHCIDIQEENCTNELCKNDHHQLQVWLEELKYLRILFKWRKVSDELPEVKQEAYWIIAKDEDMHCETFYVNNDMLYDILFYLKDYTEWMPIPQID